MTWAALSSWWILFSFVLMFRHCHSILKKSSCYWTPGFNYSQEQVKSETWTFLKLLVLWRFLALQHLCNMCGRCLFRSPRWLFCQIPGLMGSVLAFVSSGVSIWWWGGMFIFVLLLLHSCLLTRRYHFCFTAMKEWSERRESELWNRYSGSIMPQVDSETEWLFQPNKPKLGQERGVHTERNIIIAPEK